MSSERSNQQPSFPLISHPTNAAHHFGAEAEGGSGLVSSEGNSFIMKKTTTTSIMKSSKNCTSRPIAYRYSWKK